MTHNPIFPKYRIGTITATKDLGQAIGKVQSNVEDLYKLFNGLAIPGQIPSGAILSIASATAAITVANTSGAVLLTFVPGAVALSAFAAAASSISMGGFKIINLADPTNPTDAANKEYVDSATGGGVTYPIAVNKGGTGATTAAGARSNLSAAQSGVNGDITSLTALAVTLSLNTNQISNVVDPTHAQDAATKNYVDNSTGGGVTYPIAVNKGGTGSTTASGARSNLSAAQSGSNGDITNLTAIAATLSLNTNQISNVVDPTHAQDAATKNYVDALAAGLNPKAACRLATAVALPANTYNNGSSGVGATLTANANGALMVDGVSVAISDRIAIKNEVASANNGIYTVTATGDGSNPYVLTRSTDMNTPSEIPGAYTFIEAGTVNAATGYICITSAPVTIGTTAITWSQIIAPTSYTFSTGLNQTGSVVTLVTPVAVANGGTGSGTAAGARSNLSVAQSGNNSDITQLTGLTTALAAAYGGTGFASLATNDLLVGNGATAWRLLAPSNSSVLVTDGSGNVSWGTALPSGVTATTQSASDNSTLVATTAQVQAAIIAAGGGGGGGGYVNQLSAVGLAAFRYA